MTRAATILLTALVLISALTPTAIAADACEWAPPDIVNNFDEPADFWTLDPDSGWYVGPPGCIPYEKYIANAEPPTGCEEAWEGDPACEDEPTQQISPTIIPPPLPTPAPVYEDDPVLKRPSVFTIL